MLRKFKITVDGTAYLVEMEEVTEGVADKTPAAAVTTAPTVAAPAATANTATPATPPAAPAPATAAANTTAPSTGAGETISAPMPGAILKILVGPQTFVTKNQPLLILEAMKMENEIVAPADGTVTAILTSEHANVQAGTPLVQFVEE